MVRVDLKTADDKTVAFSSRPVSPNGVQHGYVRVVGDFALTRGLFATLEFSLFFVTNQPFIEPWLYLLKRFLLCWVWQRKRRL
jgi:hypothetical protein